MLRFNDFLTIIHLGKLSRAFITGLARRNAMSFFEEQKLSLSLYTSANTTRLLCYLYHSRYNTKSNASFCEAQQKLGMQNFIFLHAMHKMLHDDSANQE